MRLLILFLLTGISFLSKAQQTIVIKVISKENNAALAASILFKGTTKGYSTGSTGATSVSFPANGSYTLIITALGYEEKEIKIAIPYASDTLKIELESDEHEMEEVIVQSTRTSRTIANVPTRVETIELEEIDEKNNTKVRAYRYSRHQQLQAMPAFVYKVWMAGIHKF